MKIRLDFVTNSSSTGFIIVNHTEEVKSLTDFVKEVPEVIEDWNGEYGKIGKITMKEVLASCKRDIRTFYPGENYTSFGDEDGTVVGRVFDYMLRKKGKSKSFSWRFEQWLR